MLSSLPERDDDCVKDVPVVCQVGPKPQTRDFDHQLRAEHRRQRVVGVGQRVLQPGAKE